MELGGSMPHSQELFNNLNEITMIIDVIIIIIFLREESRLRVFENRILRRIFEPKWDENGEWRRLHNEELHSLYRSPNTVRVIKSRRL